MLFWSFWSFQGYFGHYGVFGVILVILEFLGLYWSFDGAFLTIGSFRNQWSKKDVTLMKLHRV